MKFNQIRCFLRRGVDVKVVPWDHDIASENEMYDGLFLSNGPGDPSALETTIEQVRRVLNTTRVPVFGICLGHQILARAAGATTVKMKFGNRGQNIPCTNVLDDSCYITSQNHGYAVDSSTLSEPWRELFVNANDGSNEGLYHTQQPFFSVQFHPESTPGPRDTEFLFDVFLDVVRRSAEAGQLQVLRMPGLNLPARLVAPRLNPRKVLILGSGGLSIGQAGEFDYSGSQAIKALKQEGIYTILINPNIATIQTSKGLADKVYFLPVTAEFVRKVIKYEMPDAIYVTFGGQTALNVGIELKDEFEDLGVAVLGTPIQTIITTEDRELFAQSMLEIGEKCAASSSACNIDEALTAVKSIGYPVIVRAAFALGGLGSGFAENQDQLVDICKKAFATSPQVLVEKSMKGWKEIEYEVVRDCQDNCITVCNMENFDPLGIHTGDSIVVAPSQTLSDEDYNMLRTTAINVIRHLGVIGECNIQYALNPESKEYCIIEVNARLSRSSALASKATGYPLAFIAAKLGLNVPLNAIPNSVTKTTCACFEPSLDYVVVKIPRWDLKKFTRVSTTLSSSMKSVGEVMSIGRSFEEAIQKAIRAIDYSNLGFNETDALMSIDQELQTPSDQRLFAIANAMYAGYSVDKIWDMTKIDKWFLTKLHGLITFGAFLSTFSTTTVSSNLIRAAKQAGFDDRQLAKFLGSNEMAIRRLRIEAGITPYVKQIDTVAAEFPAFANYLYLTYNAIEHDIAIEDKGVMVLGSGVYRIGSSVEFDWCAVRAVRTLREQGIKTIMVNYNPETVSTDYDEADRLYFENINLERVLDIYDIESSTGVIISMGGQTPNNIALSLYRANVNILGTSPEMIDSAENRYKFSRMLDLIGVDQPKWKELTSFHEAEEFCDTVGYPVLVRPSYVLSGAAMNTVYSKNDLVSYLKQAVAVNKDHPVVVSKYIEGAKEIEMDAVARDGKMVMHVISEHVENAGVHSGDATLILPPQDLDPETVRRIIEATAKIGNALNVTGPFNIQFIAKDNEIKVIECNVRASRSFPFVSKVLGVDMIELATKVMLGLQVDAYPQVDIPADYVAVKVPQFSFSRLSGADPVLGVEMASTGEVACFGRNKYDAYLKALISTGFRLPRKNILLSIGSFKEKMEMLPSVKKLHQAGYALFATAGTADYFGEHGIPLKYLETLADDDVNQQSQYSLTQHLANNLIDMYINLPSSNQFRRPASYMSRGYKTRRLAVDYSVPLVTNVKCAKLMVEALIRNVRFDVDVIDFQTSHKTVILPGLINVAAFLPHIGTDDGAEDFQVCTRASLSAGFSMIRVMPIGLQNSLEDGRCIALAQSSAKGNAFCDFNLSVAATTTNAQHLSQVTNQTGSLFLPFNQLSSNINKARVLEQHFDIWPASKPILTDAKGSDLASILLLTSLNNRAIHITNVSTREDVSLISLSKLKGLKVTCDVSVYSLFLSQDDFPKASVHLGTKDDQGALWEHISIIDCFSIGSLPHYIAHATKNSCSAAIGINEALPLLLTAVANNQLSLNDIVQKLYYNPKQIFALEDQEDTSVEVELDREIVIKSSSNAWSPVDGRRLRGVVHRVMFRNDTVFLDGKILQSIPKGKDVSARGQAAVVSPGISGQRQRQHTVTSSLGSPSDSAPLFGSINAAMSLPPQSPPRDYQTMVPAAVTTIPRPLTLDILRSLLHKTRFFRRHILSVKSFDRSDLHVLFGIASEMRTAVERHGVLDLAQGRVLCLMFYEPSTRTSSSFDAAMQRLGGRVVAVNASTSSVNKGETLADTIRTLACYGDAIVIRHPDADSAEIAARASTVPIINGGNGSVEHPTQAFLDLFTIREEAGKVTGLFFPPF